MDLVLNNECPRQVTSEEAKGIANENQIFYIETSAYSDYKVTEAFESLVESIYNFNNFKEVYLEKIKNVHIAQKIESFDVAKKNNQNKNINSQGGGCCN
jgi:hypothetical protein